MGDVGTLTTPRGPLGWLRLWFLLVDPVGRRDYAITGFGLMAFKYVVEYCVVRALSGHTYTPLDFINPLMSAREKMTAGAPDWFGYAWVLWALPFLWIAVGMSVRRAFDADISPWFGLLIFVPVLNLLAMLVLACLPTSHQSPLVRNTESNRHAEPDASATVKAVIGGIAVGALYASVFAQVSVYLFRDYGLALFFGTPFITGLASGYILNLRTSRSYSLSIGVAAAALLCAAAALLLFAFEGIICIGMAMPIVVPLGMAGAPIGKLLADRRRRVRGGLAGALLVLPLMAAVEAQLPDARQFAVTSAVDIAAPPETVWQHVVGFSKIQEEPEWIFRLGVACPCEAQIIGSGVGAERHCIFTTGEFVEPITVWDEPRRLAFNVREQPHPMIELTPYRHIHPPHLDLAFQSVRGEFDLTPLPGGGTRLTGRSWYKLDMQPHAYWTIWSDWLVHTIHGRVLRHIKQISENAAQQHEPTRG